MSLDSPDGSPTGLLDKTCPLPYIKRVKQTENRLNSKLMVELLRRGKNGNEILKILEAVTSDAGKVTEEVKELVMPTVPSFWSTCPLRNINCNDNCICSTFNVDQTGIGTT